MTAPFDSPATKAAAVTPNDSTVVNARRLYIGGTGNVSIIPLDGGPAVTFNSVPVGVLDVSASIVLSTGTTATNIVALY